MRSFGADEPAISETGIAPLELEYRRAAMLHALVRAA
jgi:hypothetical protein